MVKSKERILKELMEEAEGKFKGLLDWYEAHPDATLAEIEEQVGRMRQKLMGKVIEGAIESRSNGFQLEGVRCEECGEVMKFQGYREKTIQTVEGEVRVSRAYYYCPRCKRGIFPPGQGVRVEALAMERGGREGGHTIRG